MVEYCRRDTEITGRFVEEMTRTYDKIGCALKTTIAATTLDFFEREFYGSKIKHSFTENQIDFFHEGYYGGRTEIFHNAPVNGSIWYHDLNSLYPYCLKTGEFPVLESFYETKNPDLSLAGMADLEIEAPRELQIPYLPCRHDGRLVFPLGRFRGCYTYFEIRESLRLGYQIRKIRRAIEFPSTHNPFKKFVECIYSERLKAQAAKDELMSQTFKAFGNYSYGKYAQKNETTELIPVTEFKEIPNGSIILGGELILQKQKTNYPRYANCIWACYTTAYARHELYTRGLKPVEKSGASLLYCDTDSVIYEHPTQILEHSKELGAFKLEGRFRYAYFKLPKLYRLKPWKRSKPDIYRAKGVPSRVAKTFFTKSKARYKKPNKLRETLRRNTLKGRDHDLIPNFWEIHEKEISTQYEKRIVFENGATIPLILKRGQISNGKQKSGVYNSQAHSGGSRSI